jgi:hypothetical protein
MDIKKILLRSTFPILVIFLGLVMSYVFAPAKIMGVFWQVSNRAKMLSFRPDAEPTTSPWKTHIDEKHGFSFQYPGGWADVSGGYVDSGEPSGISVTPIAVPNCTTADNYLKEEILPYYANLKTVPISNPRLDGFIVEEHHLDLITPGPEAYIINCPYVIRLGFNPTGFNEGDKLFEEIILSFRTWKPSE